MGSHRAPARCTARYTESSIAQGGARAARLGAGSAAPRDDGHGAWQHGGRPAMKQRIAVHFEGDPARVASPVIASHRGSRPILAEMARLDEASDDESDELRRLHAFFAFRLQSQASMTLQ